MKNHQLNKAIIIIKQGNLLHETVDAIVCPANSFNQMRGGIAGVIRQQGGDIIEQEAMAKAPVAVGQAVITTAGNLTVKYVIHAPTMKMPVQKTTGEAVKQSMYAALKCADHYHLQSLAFPGMGTGVGGVPYSEAASVMLQEVKKYLTERNTGIAQVTIVAYSEGFYESLVEAASSLF